VLRSGDRAEIRDVEPGVAHDIHDTSYDNTYGWLGLKSFHSDDLYSRTLLYAGEITHSRSGDTEKDEYTDKLFFALADDRSYRFLVSSRTGSGTCRGGCRCGRDLTSNS
jgi:hypothetical protein